MSTQVSEKEARQVAEAARETKWERPSFGRELFLGNFRLDLIHPQPRQDVDAIEKGERFLSKLRTFLEEHVDPLEIERDAFFVRQSRPAGNLPQPGEARLRAEDEFGHPPILLLGFVKLDRSRPNHAHLAADDVDQLGKLVDARFTEPLADCSDPGVVAKLPIELKILA